MNPYAFLGKLLGIGLVAGTAVAMVKLVEKVWPKPDDEDGTFEYIAVAGEFPPEGEEAGEAAVPAPDNAADCAAEAGAAEKAAGCAAESNTAENTAEADTADPTNTPAQKSAAADTPIAPEAAPASAAPDVPDAPNENPVDAPPAVPVTDPLKIADPADFQDWDGLGCQG